MSKVVRVVGGVIGAVVGIYFQQPWLVSASLALHLGGVQELDLAARRRELAREATVP